MSSAGEPIVIADDVTVTMAFAFENFSQDLMQRPSFLTVIDQLNTPAFPVTTPQLFVVFSFQRKLPGFLVDCTIDIVPESGDPVASQKLADISFKPDQPGTRQIVGFGGITWPAAGTYVVRFRSRGKTISSFTIPVLQIKPQASGQG